MNLKNSVLLFGLLFMVGCSPKGGMPTEDVFPVQWFPGFAMSEMLAKKVQVHDLSEVQALLDKPWDFSYKLTNLQTQQVFNADRCSQILPVISHVETYRPYESRSFMYLTAMCLAAESIANARPARHSALSTFKLDANLPLYLPKNLALIISTSEWKEIAKNNDIVSWAQTETVNFVSKDGKYKAKYAMVGAYQEVSLIARGDFNHDGIEDLLLFAQGHVVGGTYAAHRLFWVTKKNTNSRITLIREFPPDSQ